MYFADLGLRNHSDRPLAFELLCFARLHTYHRKVRVQSFSISSTCTLFYEKAAYIVTIVTRSDESRMLSTPVRLVELKLLEA